MSKLAPIRWEERHRTHGEFLYNGAIEELFIFRMAGATFIVFVMVSM